MALPFSVYNIFFLVIVPREARPKAERSEVTNRVGSGSDHVARKPE